MQAPDSPTDIARQALKQLALSKIPPTPDNFRRVYDEIAGVTAEEGSVSLGGVLEKVLREAGKVRPKYLSASRTVTELLNKRDWTGIEIQLRSLLAAPSGEPDTASWASTVRNLVRQLEVSHKGLTPSKKKEGLERVLVNFEQDSQLPQKIQALVASWGAGAQPGATAEMPAPEVVAIAGENEKVVATAAPAALLWRDMLIRTLEYGLMSQLKYFPDLKRTATALQQQARQAQSEAELAKLGEALKAFWFKLEMNTEAQFRLHEELMRLLRLLVDNMGELVVEDKWLHGQTSIIRDIVSKPLDIDVLYDAESSLKELIFKQGKLKHGLVEAKDTLKQMAATFVKRLAAMTESTGEYHGKIETYQQQISTTEDITELNKVLDNLLHDTRAMQLDAMRSHGELKETQQKVVEAEQRIQQLTTELDQVSELAHQDYLTGALNRRGMSDALEREFSRSDRQSTNLCIAMMDIDHFKKLNDTLGHGTGDEALAHLAKVTRSVLRPSDVLARYGGEEFVIVLPETDREEAIQAMVRVQRELTKQFFLHENERVLITFSAGVAQRTAGEAPEAVMKRADVALYVAKQSGRNRVVGAD